MEKPHSKYLHGYAVVRVDLPINLEHPGDCIAVVKVFDSKVQAEREAERLKTINDSVDCDYLVYTTRLVGWSRQ